MNAPDKTPFFRRSGVRRALLWGGVPVLAGAFFVVPHAVAGPRWHGCPAGHGHHGPMHAESAQDLQDHMNRRLAQMLDRLDATGAQRAEAEAIVSDAAAELFPLAQQGRALRKQLKEALLAGEVDQARVTSLGAEIEATVGQATQVGIESLGKLATVLEPAQRQQVADFFASFEH